MSLDTINSVMLVPEDTPLLMKVLKQYWKRSSCLGTLSGG